MKATARSLAARVLLATCATILAGCEFSTRVVEPLPDPLMIQREPSPYAPGLPPSPAPSTRSYRLDGRKIVVDPGHGGSDPGALPKFRGQAAEKTINLDIAQRLAAELRDRGANVVMTRTGDSFPELERRAEIAERNRADFFVSIHANSITKKPEIYGAEILIYKQASRQSLSAALVLDRVLRGNGIPTRGVQRRNLKVLREHSRPGLLIECGYLTNRTEAQRLNTPDYRQRLAEVIAEGLAEALGR